MDEREAQEKAKGIAIGLSLTGVMFRISGALKGVTEIRELEPNVGVRKARRRAVRKLMGLPEDFCQEPERFRQAVIGGLVEDLRSRLGFRLVDAFWEDVGGERLKQAVTFVFGLGGEEIQLSTYDEQWLARRLGEHPFDNVFYYNNAAVNEDGSELIGRVDCLVCAGLLMDQESDVALFMATNDLPYQKVVSRPAIHS